MSKIGIISANFKREKIFEVFCAGVERLRNETGLPIPCIVAGEKTDEVDRICDEYDIIHIEHPNRPLTAKFNTACYAMRFLSDYCMVMGSDNLVSTDAFLTIKAEADKGTDLIGLSDIYFYGCDDIHTGKLIKLHRTTVLGVGRTVSGKVLDQVGWQPWGQPKDRAIDVLMLDTIAPYVKTSVLIDNQFAVDLKTRFNLNGIDFWAKRLGYLQSDDLLWRNIGGQERKLLLQILNT